MNMIRFIRNFLHLRSALKDFAHDSREANATALSSAIEYERLYLQESQNLMADEQLRTKMELEYQIAQFNLQATKAQVLNTLIQCQSMIKSLKDNAAINRANAYVGFLQVVGNATNSAGISLHSNAVINTINQIGLDSGTEDLAKFLDKITSELNNLVNLQSNDKGVRIYAPSLETLPNEPLKIYAFSTLKNANNYFLVDNVKHIGTQLLFKPKAVGVHTITFVSENANGKQEDSIEISVSDEKIKELK